MKNYKETAVEEIIDTTSKLNKVGSDFIGFYGEGCPKLSDEKDTWGEKDNIAIMTEKE